MAIPCSRWSRATFAPPLGTEGKEDKLASVLSFAEVPPAKEPVGCGQPLELQTRQEQHWAKMAHPLER